MWRKRRRKRLRSDIVSIDNSGKGFQRATNQAKKVAVYKGMGELDGIQLQVLTEEMLSLARSVAGDLNASFWIEFEGAQADLHLTTQAVLDKEKRSAHRLLHVQEERGFKALPWKPQG